MSGAHAFKITWLSKSRLTHYLLVALPIVLVIFFTFKQPKSDQVDASLLVLQTEVI